MEDNLMQLVKERFIILARRHKLKQAEQLLSHLGLCEEEKDKIRYIALLYLEFENRVTECKKEDIFIPKFNLPIVQ